MKTRTGLAVSWGVAAAVVLGAAGTALAGGEKYRFTPMPSTPASGTLRPGFVNSAGAVAGMCQSNRLVFRFSETQGTQTVGIDPGVLVLSVDGLSDQGHLLIEGCVPPPGGNGVCGPYMARVSADGSRLRLDTLPGAPAGAALEPVIVNASGSVAVQQIAVGLGGETVYVYDDASGWRSFAEMAAPLTPVRPVLLGLNASGQVLARGSDGTRYLYTPGAGARVVGWAAGAINDRGDLAGSAVFAGLAAPARQRAGGALENLDPAGVLPGASGSVINASGMVAGLWNGRAFLFTDALGAAPVPLAGAENGSPTHVQQITGLNARGDLSLLELSDMYESVPVIKLMGQPVKRVQDEIDPLHQRIRVTGATAVNDAGQFAVTGYAPGGWTTVTFLVSPQPCRADLDGSGTVGLQDLFEYLRMYFAAEAGAEFDGAAGVGVGDLFAFLAAYFTGC